MSHYEKLKRMIEERRIEEAAFDFNDGELTNDKLIRAAFIYSAKWMQEEFLKNLWHTSSEEPRVFAEVLAEAKITESIKTYISFKRNDALFKNWDAYSSGANITRWLYIDDLFPNKGD